MKNETESPFGSPRFLAALAITFLSLWGWQYYMNQKYPPQKVVATESTQVQKAVPNTEVQQPADKSPQDSSLEAATAAATNIDFSNEKVSFSVSSNGLGFSQFTVKEYKDRDGNFVKYEPTTPMFALLYKNQPIQFNVIKKSDNEFVGEAIVEGKKVIRTLSFDPKLMSISSRNFL